MATRKPDKPKHDVLPGESEIARVYHEAGRDAPPSKLDAQILAAARAAVQPLPVPHKRWAVPLSTAAVVVLAVSVLLLMTKEGTLDRNGGLTVPDEYSLPSTAEAPAPVSAPPLADAREERQVAPAKMKPAAPEAAKPLAESAEQKAVAPAELAKKAEVPAASPPPAVVGRAVEMDRMKSAREETSRARQATAGVAAMKTQGADVVAVQVSGSPGAYTFNVTVKSLDTGCQQYADWWEVVSEDGKLLYRRVLLHSHVGEQPFTRDGGPVPVQPDTPVWVRAHMNTSGYGGAALKGSVKSGFRQAQPPANFAAGLARQSPLPEGCDF